MSRWVFETNPWAKHTPTLVRLEMLERTSPGHYLLLVLLPVTRWNLETGPWESK
jgi:hypothetical protein